jgi:ankyrin repeat protein
MASAAQGGGVGIGGGSNGNNNDNDLSCVYRAVDRGASAEQVRAILSGGPRTRRARSEWLEGVVNHKSADNNDETPLQAAHRRRNGPLVGALLEHGADPCALGPNANALAICIAYGQVNSLRILLRSGRHSADEEIAYWTGSTVAGADDPGDFCRPVHLCVVPPRLSHGGHPLPPPRLVCLDVLVREFGADVNGRDCQDNTPLHWLMWTADADKQRAFDALLALAADVNARDDDGLTPIFWVISEGVQEMMHQLLARGALANVITDMGLTPLYRACIRRAEPGTPAHAQRRAMVLALLPLSSTETRRSVSGYTGRSALDCLLERLEARIPEAWERHAIEELLSSRVRVLSENAPRLLPIAARLAERRSNQLARRNRSGAMHWRAHEDLVGLAFDFQDLRAAEEGVRRREARVAELEEKLRRRGIGSVEEDESGGGDE